MTQNKRRGGVTIVVGTLDGYIGAYLEDVSIEEGKGIHPFSTERSRVLVSGAKVAGLTNCMDSSGARFLTNYIVSPTLYINILYVTR